MNKTDKEERPDLESIIDKPYPMPTKRPRMTMEARAAQFAPFAALNGHDSPKKKRFSQFFYRLGRKLVGISVKISNSELDY